ncbi:MAG: histidinol dehydrogenase, partial [Euryarchaeota archaeon RBG_16_62_10]
RAGGDRAVMEYARRLDGLAGGPLTLPAGAIRSGREAADERLLSALRASKKRIEAFHRRQSIRPFSYRDDCGSMGLKVVPLRRVGVYVPGGSADYMSTVLMACVPATVAGVREIAMCTPGREGRVPDGILAAADICGVKEIHPVGGAQAVAAMAFGTESIPKVQKIVGPGGAVVSAAKLLVRNDCEIDFLAGPSEVLVIADESADPELVASDMLAQLEHDPLARAVLVTTSSELLEQARDELVRQVGRAGRSGIARKSSDKGAVFVLAGSLEEAIEFSNEYAPEHLLIDVKRPERVLGKVESAGSVFIGRYSTVAFGDYCSGTNHILPTKGAAATRSSLSVYDFLKIIPFQSISAQGAVRLSGVVDTLARAEGLPAHADAALLRARRAKR